MTWEEAIASLLASDAWETRLVLRSEQAQLLLFRRPGERKHWVELGHGRQAGPTRAELVRLGLSRGRFMAGPKTWGRTYDGRIDAEALRQSVVALWEGACGGGEAHLELLAQREAPPQNPRLLEAIRAAADKQDGPTRQALYAALANATLLVPIDPDSLASEASEQRPLRLGRDPDGTALWGAFSDWDALRQWQPRGHAFGPVHGAEFFAHVHDLGRCGVRINPDGLIGGELYPGEVEMMVEAVRRYYRQTMS